MCDGGWCVEERCCRRFYNLFLEGNEAQPKGSFPCFRTKFIFLSEVSLSLFLSLEFYIFFLLYTFPYTIIQHLMISVFNCIYCIVWYIYDSICFYSYIFIFFYDLFLENSCSKTVINSSISLFSFPFSDI